jgi:hypothetical protein
MKSRKYPVFLLLLLLAGLTFPLRGEVFSLWPFRGGGNNISGSSGYAPESLFNPESLRKEPVLINGTRAFLECSLGDYIAPEDALRILQKEYPSSKAALNKNAILFEGPTVGSYRKRFLFLIFPGMEKGLLFTMQIPKEGFPAPSWPPELPHIPGIRPQTVIAFPERNSIYGQAASTLSPQELLSHLAAELKANGWIAPAREYMTKGGSGEVFFRKDSSQLLIFGILPMKKRNGMPESIVTIYSRKLK